MHFLVALILFLVTTVLYGQSKNFDERYNEIYHTVFVSSPKEALSIADSLYHVAADDEQRMKALMLLGTIYHGLGDVPEALFHGTKAQEIAKKGHYVAWEARTMGFLANTYRIIGLLEEAKNGFEQAEKLNESQKESPSYFLTKANILQERAHIAGVMDGENYALALDYLYEAARCIDQDTSNPERAGIVRAMNLQLQGVCYLHQDNLFMADSVLQVAKAIIGSKNSALLPYIYRARAESALKRQEYDSVYHYLQLTTPFVASSKDLEMLVYDSYAKYYTGLGDNEQAMQYLNRKQEFAKLRLQNANKIVNEFVRKLNEDNQSYQTEITLSSGILIGTVFLFCVVLMLLWIKRRKEKARYIQVIERLQSENTSSQTSPEVFAEEQEVAAKNNKDMLISKDTEIRLLAELEKLEETGFFLDKDVSLASLAIKLNTNQRYVSYTIRRYRDKDFNTYLQHLRIHHIMNRIRLEPELLNYKLSYLAGLAGFPSHSKFSSVFKSVAGIPPSVFIHYTREESSKHKHLAS